MNLSAPLAYLAIGAIGGLLGYKLKVPSGALIGSMIAVIGLKLVFETGWRPPKHYELAVQVLLGVMIGSTFEREMIGSLTKLLLPIICSTLVLAATGLALTLIFYKMGLMNVSTSYLGTNPGAMSILVFLAFENNADPAVALTFHFFRVVFVVLTAPWIVRLLSEWF